MSADLAAFLLARFDEDEAEARSWAARAAATPHGDVILDRIGGKPWPTRVLAECEAKRQIVEEHRRQWSWNAAGGHSPMNGYIGNGRLRGLWTALQCLALPYADHPDYDPSWRP